MRCIKCGLKITVGNSRIIERNGKKFHQHKICRPLDSPDARKKCAGQAPMIHPKPSEPKTRQSSEPHPKLKQVGLFEQSTNFRYFVMPGTLEKLKSAANKTIVHGLVNVEVHIFPTSIVEETPELLGALNEIHIN